MIKKLIVAAVMSCISMGAANAAVKSYDISWVGANNYTMTGNFQFDDATAGTSVDETELTSFFIEGFLNGSSLGAYTGAVENFNFDAIAGSFLVGGVSTGTSGQIWNYEAPGFGFASGSGAQMLSLDNSNITDSLIYARNSTLSASLSVVPLPAALPLYAAGVAVLGFFGFRAKRIKTVAA